jgi:hypothetical protein
MLLVMALIFQVDDKGHLGPKIRCDHCGAIVENYAGGAALLDTPSPKPGTIIDPIFHCAGCEESAQKTGESRRSMPIDHFMLYLLNNIQLTPKALEEAGQKLRVTSAWR